MCVSVGMAGRVLNDGAVGLRVPRLVWWLVLLLVRVSWQQDSDTLTLSQNCSVASMSPTAGPTAGGTLVYLSGSELGDGSAWRCAFGESVVGAEYFELVERVGCHSPPMEDAIKLVVNVSIDGGSSFCSGETQRFQYYEAPTVSSISPASGAAEGGTLVTVSGSGFGAATSARTVCTFGVTRAGDGRLLAGALSEAFWQPAVGNGTSSNGTSSDGAGTLTCSSPSASAAAAVGVVLMDFGAPLPPAEVLVGCSSTPFVGHDGCVPGVEPERQHALPGGHSLRLLGHALREDGLLKLTRARTGETGSAIFSLYNPGAAAGVPIRDLDASWTQLVGRGTAADGYSFVYGDLDGVRTPFGEMGPHDAEATAGLVVRFRTRGYFGDANEGHGVIQVAYNGIELNETFMGERYTPCPSTSPVLPPPCGRPFPCAPPPLCPPSGGLFQPEA